jgi:hypothetical protein
MSGSRWLSEISESLRIFGGSGIAPGAHLTFEISYAAVLTVISSQRASPRVLARFLRANIGGTLRFDVGNPDDPLWSGFPFLRRHPSQEDLGSEYELISLRKD